MLKYNVAIEIGPDRTREILQLIAENGDQALQQGLYILQHRGESDLHPKYAEPVDDQQWLLPINAEGEEVDVPAIFEKCDRCGGKGTHTNPSIDGHGISSEEFDEDPDFKEDYMSGAYDIECTTCKGATKTLTADLKKCTPSQKKSWEESEDADYQYDAEVEAERRMGA